MFSASLARLVALLTLLALALAAAPAQAQPAIAAEPLTVALGDGWQSQGMLTYPAGAAGRLPTVILLNNTGTDMDFTMPPFVGGPATPYKDLAETLSARGLAVFRFNMRYVTSADEADSAKIGAMKMTDHLADAEAILALVQQHPRVDSKRIFFHGWSASSPVAAAVAARHPELAGLILQGPIASTERQIYIEDYERVVLPYVLRFAPNGQITANALGQAIAGEGAWFAKSLSFDLTDPASPDAIKVNPFLDTNKDGVLDLNGEVRPNLGALVDSDPVGFIAYTRGLPNVYSQAANIRVPVLILQGENDPSTRLINTSGLKQAFASHPDFTFKVYPGLGHSLSPTPSMVDDRLNLLAAGPKADYADWVLAHARPTPAALPKTGGGQPTPLLVLLVALVLLGVGLGLRRARA